VIVPEPLSESAKGRVCLSQESCNFFIKGSSTLYAAAKVAEGVCNRKRGVINSNYWRSVCAIRQGCGLGLDVSVSRRSRDILTSRLGVVSDKVLNISVSSRTNTSRALSRSRHKTSRRLVSGYFVSSVEMFCVACMQCGAV